MAEILSLPNPGMSARTTLIALARPDFQPPSRPGLTLVATASVPSDPPLSAVSGSRLVRGRPKNLRQAHDAW
jgi:hypothetical protein